MSIWNSAPRIRVITHTLEASSSISTANDAAGTLQWGTMLWARFVPPDLTGTWMDDLGNRVSFTDYTFSSFYDAGPLNGVQVRLAYAGDATHVSNESTGDAGVLSGSGTATTIAFASGRSWYQPSGQDHDGDGVNDDTDHCPFTFNPDHADTDSDGQEDACDADDTGSGLDFSGTWVTEAGEIVCGSRSDDGLAPGGAPCHRIGSRTGRKRRGQGLIEFGLQRGVGIGGPPDTCFEIGRAHV